MYKTLFIIVGMVVLILLEHLLDTLSTLNPPKGVKTIDSSEMLFGLLVLSSCLYFGAIERNKTLTILALVIGICWFVIPIGLYSGKNWARLLCLVLSILRLFTIIGIPFSLISFYVLLYSKESKAYFRPKQTKKSDDNHTEKVHEILKV